MKQRTHRLVRIPVEQKIWSVSEFNQATDEKYGILNGLPKVDKEEGYVVKVSENKYVYFATTEEIIKNK